MTAERWTSVDRYIEDLLLEEDPVLDAVSTDATKAGLPAISVSAAQGKMLHLLARATGARRILELGTLAGYSGTWLARALPPDGRLITLEFEPRHAAVARRCFERAGVADRVDIRIGAALELLPVLERERVAPFDFVFIDADKGNYDKYLDWSIRLCRPGAMIVADNVVRDGAVVDAGSDDPSVQGARRFMAAVSKDPRVDATAIQTVGVKGYDGFALMLVGANRKQDERPREERQP